MNTNHFMNRFWAISTGLHTRLMGLMDISGPKQVVYSQDYLENGLAISTDYTQG